MQHACNIFAQQTDTFKILVKCSQHAMLGDLICDAQKCDVLAEPFDVPQMLESHCTELQKPKTIGEAALIDA